jgi:hypothetical protein
MARPAARKIDPRGSICLLALAGLLPLLAFPVTLDQIGNTNRDQPVVRDTPHVGAKSPSPTQHRASPREGIVSATQRKPYFESCEVLRTEGYLEKDEKPPLPARRPQHDDQEPLGITFFRTLVVDSRLENMTLPRTFFGRSEIRSVSFRNTDLSESTLCWNDFTDVGFEQADLSRSDLRASLFENVRFVGAQLRESDLRHSTFTNCDFASADLAGAKVTRDQAAQLKLTKAQREQVDWKDSPGDEPPGG